MGIGNWELGIGNWELGIGNFYNQKLVTSLKYNLEMEDIRILELAKRIKSLADTLNWTVWTSAIFRLQNGVFVRNRLRLNQPQL